MSWLRTRARAVALWLLAWADKGSATYLQANTTGSRADRRRQLREAWRGTSIDRAKPAN